MIEYQRHLYLKIVMVGICNQYLREIDEACHREVELVMEKIKKKEDVTEQLKAENPLEWVGRVNGIKTMVEDMLGEKVFGSAKNEF